MEGLGSEIRFGVSRLQSASTVPPPEDGTSTTAQTAILTDARRLVLVAMVSGYLEPFPRYDPKPLSYAEVAARVGLPRSTVVTRIEAVRDQLREWGVPGLDDADARRALAEWLLAMRVITPDDLGWLRQRIAQMREETA